MIILSTLVVAGVGGVWLLLRHFRFKFDWIEQCPLLELDSGVTDRISMIIPARNEEAAIPALLASLVGRGPPDMEIIVVDDQSTDATAALVGDAMRHDPRIKLLTVIDKPGEWAGKTWALTRGAREAHGDWLIFCDADLVFEKDAVAAAVSVVRHERLDCLSLIPRMRSSKFAVNILLACLATSRALLFRPARPGRAGIIQGAFIMVARKTFDAVGGYASIMNSLLEDVDFGRLLQFHGHRVATWPAFEMLRTPMYASVRSAVEGMSKHLFAAVSFSPARLAYSTLIHVGLLIMPVAAAMVCLCVSTWATPMNSDFMIRAFVAATQIAMLGMFVTLFELHERENLPFMAIVLVPFTMFMFGVILLLSVYGYRHGAIIWKGREYPAASRQ